MGSLNDGELMIFRVAVGRTAHLRATEERRRSERECGRIRQNAVVYNLMLTCCLDLGSK